MSDEIVVTIEKNWENYFGNWCRCPASRGHGAPGETGMACRRTHAEPHRSSTVVGGAANNVELHISGGSWTCL